MAKKKGPTPKKKPNPKTRLKMMVIPEPDPKTRSILDFQGIPAGQPCIDAADKPDLVWDCGGCGRVLVRGMRTTQLQSIVLRCPDCRAFNDSFQ